MAGPVLSLAALTMALLSCAQRSTPGTASEPTPTSSRTTEALAPETATPATDFSARATATAVSLAQTEMVGGYLIEAQSGRVTRLWEQWGYQRGTFATFSADGRFLVYNRPYPVTDEGEIYLVDLSRPSPAPIAKGRIPKLSPPGNMLAFLTQDMVSGTQTTRVNVRAADGTVRALHPPGNNHRWSPDGRWLTFITREHQLAPLPKPPEWPWPSDQDSAIILVNTRDWSSQAVGLVYSCHCGAQYGAFWTPDSKWFTYRFASERVDFLVSPETLERVPTTREKWKELDFPEDPVIGEGYSWDKRIRASVRALPCPTCRAPEDRRSYELFLIDTTSGEEQKVVGPVTATFRIAPGVVWSPDSRYLLFCDGCWPQMTLDRGN